MRDAESASSLRMLFACGEQYRRRYVEGEKIPPGVAAHSGKGVHLSQAKNLQWRFDNKHGEELPLDHCESIARDETVAGIESGTLWKAGEDKASATADAVDSSVRLAGLIHKDLTPQINPASREDIERAWRVEFDGFPFALMGYFDVVEESTVRDLKTKRKSPSQGEADSSEQLTLYALARKVEAGKIPEVALDFAVDLKRGPKVVVQTSTRTDAHLDVELRRVEAAARLIESATFVPAASDSWLCDERWCGYASTCPYYLRSPNSYAVKGGAR